MLKILTTLLLTVLTITGYGQSCCSGGVPISSNLGLPWSEEYRLQFSVSYDLNLLNTLKDGTERLEGNSRKRLTHTALFQVGYAVSKRIALDLLIPYVRQERELQPIGVPSTFDYSQGIGDVVALVKYRFLDNYQVGLGLKLPTGSTEEAGSNGVFLNADMQPGSGSWDVIYWFSGKQGLKIRPSSSLGLAVTYRATGDNKSYLGNETYSFGNEFQSTINYSDQILLGSLVLSPYLGLRYRTVSFDEINGSQVPSTGGAWLFVRPGVFYSITPKITLQTVVDVPIYSNLEGTQVTPTSRFNFSLFIKVSTSKNTFL